jgi:propanol-preferring alcohol dehydrogenase
MNGMRAMVLDRPRTPLRVAELPDPVAGPGQIRIRVRACAVCRTDLHVVDGELPDPKLPLVLGHQVVGEVIDGGTRFRPGQRVGVPWLGFTDQTCRYCRSGRENLCLHAEFTGYHRNGGYAELIVADEQYCFPIPAGFDDAAAAPLLCAGMIGFRSLRLADDAERLGLYGFGASAHIVAQVARFQGRRVFAFTRSGDTAGQQFARDAAIIFAPVGALVPAALRVLARGGVVVCAGIHMSDIPSFPYAWLWEERSIRSVANLTRQDGEEFLALAPRVPIRTFIEVLPLTEANEALRRLRAGELHGSAVLRVAG